jgi:mannose/fructose/N-acetylgalactosamine-specific phosphotransferase system component IID
MGWRVLWRVAARSMLLEANWNNRNQQGLGFLAAIDPALEVIYDGDPEALTGARLKALTFFNTNPVSGGLVIGAALKLEEETRRGFLEEGRRATILSALSSAMAAQGDRLFWRSWLPVCGLAACLAFCLTGDPRAPILIPILYGAVSLAVRLKGLSVGYREGREVYTVIRRCHADRLARVLADALTILLALLTAVILWTAVGSLDAPPWRPVAAAAAVFAAVRLYQTAVFRRRPWAAWLLYPALVAVAALAASLT